MTHIRKKALVGLATALGVGVLMAPAASADKPECNWGELTAANVPLGAHSSSFDTPRVGLANVVAQGNLDATCLLLS